MKSQVTVEPGVVGPATWEDLSSPGVQGQLGNTVKQNKSQSQCVHEGWMSHTPRSQRGTDFRSAMGETQAARGKRGRAALHLHDVLGQQKNPWPKNPEPLGGRLPWKGHMLNDCMQVSENQEIYT